MNTEPSQGFSRCGSKRLPFRTGLISPRQPRVSFPDQHKTRLAGLPTLENRYDDLQESQSQIKRPSWNSNILMIGLFIAAAGIMWAALLIRVLILAYEFILALLQWQMWFNH